MFDAGHRPPGPGRIRTVAPLPDALSVRPHVAEDTHKILRGNRGIPRSRDRQRAASRSSRADQPTENAATCVAAFLCRFQPRCRDLAVRVRPVAERQPCGSILASLTYSPQSLTSLISAPAPPPASRPADRRRTAPGTSWCPPSRRPARTTC